jgi:hypothetical protein
VLRRDGGFGLFFVIFPNLIQHIGLPLPLSALDAWRINSR